MKKDPSVAIVIVNWNGLKLTDACLDSLKELKYSNYKIVVVDNNSADNSVSFFKSKYDDIEIIALNRNTGFTGGNNAGIEWALEENFDYILLLNNDTVVNDVDFLSTMITDMEADETAGMACPMILHYDNVDKIWYGGAKCSLWRGWTHYHSKPEQTGVKNTGYATGCCMLVKSKTIREIGLLNSAYFLSVEDVEWSVRAKKAGWNVIFVPEASVLHKVSMSTRSRGKGTFSPTRIYYDWRNGIWFIREYANSFQKSFVWPLRYTAQFLLRMAAYIVLGRWQKLKAMTKAIKDGLSSKSQKFKNKHS